jgi:cell division protein FtsB
MIQLPQRSVTRFFIPLIDVLTLLFCIFLVMPLAKGPEDTAADVAALEDQIRQKEQELEQIRASGRDLPRELRDEIDKLRREKGKALQKRLAVRVLEIDGESGKLYYRDPERIPISDEAAAHALIESDHRKLGQKELYYLILYPRSRGSTYPTVAQRQQYDRWFESVALGYDVLPTPLGGSQP